MKKVLLLLLIFSAYTGFSQCMDPVLTDFECSAPSHPLGGGAAVTTIANPFPGGINMTANVGEVIDDGTQLFDGIIVDYGAPIDLTTNPIFHIKVYTELVTPIPIVAKVEGGNQALEIQTDIETTDEWTEYTFDFSSVATEGNTTLAIFFNFNQTDGTATDTYYIDDLFFGPAPSTCQDPILSNFECDNPSHPFIGGTTVTKTANPFPGGINTSVNVGEAIDDGTQPFDALIVDYGMPIDLATNPIFHIKIYTELATPISFVAKVEGGNQALEIQTNIDVTDQWAEYTFDFSSVANEGNTTLVLFFNFNDNSGTTTDTYYIDDLFFAPIPTVCEDPLLTDFECEIAAEPISGDVVTIANPFPGGINTSDNVGEYTDSGDEAFDNLAVNYEMPIDLSTNNKFRVKIYTEQTANLMVKLEGGTSTPIELGVVGDGQDNLDVVNQWKEYEFDFSSQAGENHERLVLFFNAGNNQAGPQTFYVDDLRWESQNLSVDNPEERASFSIYPNPVQNKVHIDAEVAINAFQIVDLSGKVMLQNAFNENVKTIDVSSLSNGMYFLILKSATVTQTLKLVKQ